MKKTAESVRRFLRIFNHRLPFYVLSSAGVSCRNFLLTWMIAFIGSRVIAVVESGTTDDLGKELLRFASILFVYILFDSVAMYLMAVTNQKIENDLRYSCVKGVLGTSLQNCDKIGGRGEFLSRINRDTALAMGLLSGGIISVAMCAISGVGASAVIAREYIWICVGLWLLGIGGYFLQNRVTVASQKLRKQQREISTRAMALLLQIVSRSSDIKMSNKASFAFTRYQREIEKYKTVSKKLSLMSGIFDGISNGVNFLGFWGSVGVCIWLYCKNGTSLESAVMVSQMSALVTTMALSLYMFLSNLRGSMVGVDRVLELTELPLEELGGEPLDLGADARNLVYAKNVECTFEGGVSLSFGCDIPKNKLVALVGESGRGKTTLIRLLLKLCPYSGKLEIGNTDVRHCSAQEIRNSVSYVPQENPVLGGTLREMLIFGNCKDVSDSEIWNALECVGAEKWVGGLEKGLESNLIDGGTTISGGQRQMLAIARAILYGRKILFLDEAFSGMDENHIALIVPRLKALCDECSVIIVTHDERVRNLCDICVEI